jgi:hypothetical protein
VAGIYVVTETRGPAWEDGFARRDQPGWDAHAAYMDALVDEGFILAGGPLGDPDTDDVLLVVRAAGEDAVHERLAADPWVGSVLSVASVRPWSVWLGAVGRVERG